MTETPIDVLIVDDHTLFAEGLRAVLERAPDIVVVGIVGTADDAVRFAEKEAPRVILMDHHLPGATGVDAARRIKAGRVAGAIVMLTGGATRDDMLDAVAAGVCGYLGKTAKADEVTDAVRRAAAGEMLVPADVLSDLVALGRRRAQERLEREVLGASLTAREHQVLGHMAQGRDTKEIAERLVLSAHTVRGHVQTIIEKLQVHSRLEAVIRAGQLGIVKR